jgi:hypothetical protein
MQTINIDHNGGAVVVTLSFPTPQVIAYNLQVYKPNSNDTLLDVNGNNQNTADDSYALPGPASTNVGCLLWCTTTIIDPNGAGSPYTVTMEVSQPNASGVNTVLGTVSANGTTTDTHVVANLIATLA